MKFNYQNDGDILYGVETFRFRLQGKETADITLLNLLDDEQYGYEIQVNKNILPSFETVSSTDYELFQSLKVEFKPFFNSKQEALQHAIDVISEVVTKTQEV
ncbi:hypothetical protein [Sporosarcina sp. BP05]|uniref:hypothetical protein n=1 Tax=Sporosarcina sp. BP05 TaxID=2758726 RepID=UPI00164543B9|nr:hypothetical protein [Sporosarcina sp. BP05]